MIIRLLRALWILTFMDLRVMMSWIILRGKSSRHESSLAFSRVTSFLPTALTAPFEELKAICQTTANTVGRKLVPRALL